MAMSRCCFIDTQLLLTSSMSTDQPFYTKRQQNCTINRPTVCISTDLTIVPSLIGSSGSVDISGVTVITSNKCKHNNKINWKFVQFDASKKEKKKNCILCLTTFFPNVCVRPERPTKQEYFQCGFFNIILFTWNSFRNV